MRRRRRHRQGNFAANCVRGALLRVRELPQNFVEGCKAERRLRRMQRGGAGAAVAERKRHTWRAARCGHRNPASPKGEIAALGTAVRGCCPLCSSTLLKKTAPPQRSRLVQVKGYQLSRVSSVSGSNRWILLVSIATTILSPRRDLEVGATRAMMFWPL